MNRAVHRAAAVWDVLESRVLRSVSLDDYTMTIVGTGGNDQISISMSNNIPGISIYTTVEVNGEKEHFEGPVVSHFRVFAGGGNDTIDVDGINPSLDAIVYGGDGNDLLRASELHLSTVTYHGGAGSDKLFVEGTYNIGGGIGFYPQLEYTITSKQVAFDTPQYTDDALGVYFDSVNAIDFLGSAGDYKVWVQSVAAGTTLNVWGNGGNDTYTVGGGNVAGNIKGQVNLDPDYFDLSPTQVDKLLLDDTKGAGGSNTLTSSTFKAAGMSSAIKLANFKNVVVNGSTHNDVINVTSSPAKNLQINAGGGNDVINLGSPASGLNSVATSTIGINGGGGSDVVSANDLAHQGGVSYKAEVGTFSRAGVTPWSLGTIERLDVSLGSGNNTFDGSSSSVPLVVNGGNGNDILIGSAFGDVLRGGGQSLAGQGNDSLIGLGGSDLLDGGVGDDVISGGAGFDTVTYVDRILAVNVDLNRTTGNGQSGESDSIQSDVEAVEGGGGNDTLVLRTSTAGIAYGDGGNDSITGGNLNDSLYGGGGDDLLKGNAGNDLLDGGIGHDRLSGGAGDDKLVSTDGETDTVSGDAGNDTLLRDMIDAVQAVA